MAEKPNCKWYAEDAGMKPDGTTFVDAKCLTCGHEVHVAPDPWRSAEALSDDPPDCPQDDRQAVLEGL